MTLFIGLAKASVIPKENPTICVALHCFMETGACWADSECYAILDCLQVKRTMGSTFRIPKHIFRFNNLV